MNKNIYRQIFLARKVKVNFLVSSAQPVPDPFMVVLEGPNRLYYGSIDSSYRSDENWNTFQRATLSLTGIIFLLPHSRNSCTRDLD